MKAKSKSTVHNCTIPMFLLITVLLSAFSYPQKAKSQILGEPATELQVESTLFKEYSSSNELKKVIFLAFKSEHQKFTALYMYPVNESTESSEKPTILSAEGDVVFKVEDTLYTLTLNLDQVILITRGPEVDKYTLKPREVFHPVIEKPVISFEVWNKNLFTGAVLNPSPPGFLGLKKVIEAAPKTKPKKSQTDIGPQTLKIHHEVFKKMYRLGNFYKMKFVPFKNFVNELNLFVYAMSGDDESTALNKKDKIVLSKNNPGRYKENIPKEIGYKGWSLTKEEIRHIFPGEITDFSYIILKPRLSQGKKYVSTYEIWVDERNTGAVLNPSPPGFLFK